MLVVLRGPVRMRGCMPKRSIARIMPACGEREKEGDNMNVFTLPKLSPHPDCLYKRAVQNVISPTGPRHVAIDIDCQPEC